ncbi:MAG: histidine kinase dimerization/phospho-acceptor domain-containing protein, partial [Candidatus Nitrosomaritimum aestuariumsis]
MNQKSKNNRFLPIWGVTLVSVLGSIAGLYFININIGINDFSNLISLPLFSIIPGFLIILSVWAVAESKNIVQIPRNSLIFLTLAFSCWFAAEQIWNLYEHVLGIDPYPSIADFFYLAAPILMFVGLILYLKSTEKKISKKAIFVGIAASLIILIPSVLSIWEISFEDEPIEIIIALAYPVVDAALLVPLIIAMLFLITNRRDFFWMMILAGIATMIAADSIFLFLIIEDAYVDGHPVDILFVSSYTIWSFMMFYLVRQSKQETKSNLQEINARNTKAIEKYGVHLALIFINLTVVVFLIGTSFYMGPDSEDGILQFFFWFLIVLVIIFSSIVVILNSRLNKSLENRTKQLEDISKELIKNERFSAIGELASRISHDIRNPLSNIQMSIELMKNSPKDAKISDDEINVKLQLVSKNIERISHQVNDVLGYVKNQTMN